MKTRFVLLCLGLLFAVTTRAGKADGAATKGTKDMYEVVKTARQFVIGGTGVAATISSEERAFRQLLEQPEPLARCQKLLAEGTPAGQLYGLLGLHRLDLPAFEKAYLTYRDSKVAIDSIGGCIHFRTTTAEIAKEIEKGDLK